jgi:hypothetical protein
LRIQRPSDACPTPLTAADLPGLVMKATAGANDTVKLVWTGGGAAYSEPSALSLSKVWTETEFNVVGDCCSGNAVELAARTGTVFAAPVSFADFYHPYADSWRVQSKDTLLSPCGDRDIETGAASKPFYANDLEPQVAERAREICTAAHVKEGPQLDACTLDAAVLGGAEAAKVFARTLPIRAVLRPGLPLERIEIKPIKRP